MANFCEDVTKYRQLVGGFILDHDQIEYMLLSNKTFILNVMQIHQRHPATCVHHYLRSTLNTTEAHKR
ncbi:unnamed protein product [Dovyalis caffra]|uniref:Uncharacterized protein n=1 Tax=Dovyalis caffra TaxID=77055 RepID=A0AAV1S264_9ROSI|nr:unnamed protein product [Dovyalis caffra]